MSFCCSQTSTKINEATPSGGGDRSGMTKTFVAHISVQPTFLVHVLDTSSGLPAASVPVTLYEQTTKKGWETAEEGHTLADGKLRLLKGRNLTTGGRYKLHLDTGDYFRGRGEKSVYPFIEIGLEIPVDVKNLHVSIHIGRHGYATYFGT